MSSTNAKSIVEEFFNETWVKKNINAWDALPDDLIFWSFGTKFEGRERWMEAFVRPLSKGFPDLRVEPEFTVAEEDKVVIRWRGTGTHSGDFRGIAATGKSIDIVGVAIYRVEEGQIVEGWSQADSFALLSQIGAI